MQYALTFVVESQEDGTTKITGLGEPIILQPGERKWIGIERAAHTSPEQEGGREVNGGG